MYGALTIFWFLCAIVAMIYLMGNDMPRPRLTPEEREAKRRARSRHTFSDAAYRHYNPRTEGFGSRSEWEKIAEEIFRDLRTEAPSVKVEPGKTDILAPGYAPKSRAQLMADFRKAARITHPDMGGNPEAFRRVVETCERIKRQKGW